MSMLTIFNGKNSTLSTDQLVYSPGDVNLVRTATEKIQLLDKKIAEYDLLLAQSKEEATARGLKKGFARGRAIARRKISLALLASQQEATEQRSAMRETSVQLALEIVRRIGLENTTAETLVSLAVSSAKELEPDEKASLSVHPEVSAQVKERLEALPQAQRKSFLEVTTDSSLKMDDCVLKTACGSLLIGLESQLRIIERSLNEHIS